MFVSICCQALHQSETGMALQYRNIHREAHKMVNHKLSPLLQTLVEFTIQRRAFSSKQRTLQGINLHINKKPRKKSYLLEYYAQRPTRQPAQGSKLYLCATYNFSIKKPHRNSSALSADYKVAATTSYYIHFKHIVGIK